MHVAQSKVAMGNRTIGESDNSNLSKSSGTMALHDPAQWSKVMTNKQQHKPLITHQGPIRQQESNPNRLICRELPAPPTIFDSLLTRTILCIYTIPLFHIYHHSLCFHSGRHRNPWATYLYNNQHCSSQHTGKTLSS